MRALSQFMCTRMCCLREKQVVQIMLTLTDRFTHLFFIPHVYCIAGNYRGVHIFAIWLQSPQQKCLWVLFNARKPHPPIALHVKYRYVGVYPSLVSIFVSSFSAVAFFPCEKSEILHIYAAVYSIRLYNVRFYQFVQNYNYTCTFTWILSVVDYV